MILDQLQHNFHYLHNLQILVIFLPQRTQSYFDCIICAMEVCFHIYELNCISVVMVVRFSSVIIIEGLIPGQFSVASSLDGCEYVFFG